MHTARTELERWFIRRGVPHFIEPYAAGSAIWTRAIPVLAAAYLLGGFHGLDLAGWTLQRNLLAALVVVVVLVAAWVATNRLRHRPALSRPSRLGPPELLVFLVGPSVPSAIFGQWGDVGNALIEGVAVLLVIYVVTSYGILPIVRWAGSQLIDQVGAVGRMLTRALPLLLLFTTFLFINAEVWEVAGTLDGIAFPIVIGLFFLLGSAFVLSRVPAAIAAVSDFDHWEEVRSLVVGTPAEGLDLPSAGDPAEIPLSVRQRVNIGLVTLFSQAILITVVAVALSAFFIVFGVLAVSADTATGWTTLEQVNVLAEMNLGDRRLVLSEQHLRVAAFLGAFTGMYFTVVLGTDSTYREEFARDTRPEIRQALAVRLAYRHAHG
jgi:hypothetical protein